MFHQQRQMEMVIHLFQPHQLIQRPIHNVGHLSTIIIRIVVQQQEAHLTHECQTMVVQNDEYRLRIQM